MEKFIVVGALVIIGILYLTRSKDAPKKLIELDGSLDGVPPVVSTLDKAVANGTATSAQILAAARATNHYLNVLPIGK